MLVTYLLDHQDWSVPTFGLGRGEDIFCPGNIPNSLRFDQACIVFENTLPEAVTLFKKFDICFKCSEQFWTNVLPKKSVSLLVPVDTKISFQYFHLNYEISSCIVNYQFEQHGVYQYFIDFSCDSVNVVVPPDYPYTSLFICIVIILIIWVIDMFLLNKFVRRGCTYIGARIRTLLSRLKGLPKEVQSDVEFEDVKANPREDDLDHLERIIQAEEVVSNEQIGDFVSRGVTTASSIEGIGSRSIEETKHLEFVEFEALLAFRGLFAVLWVFFTVDSSSYTLMKSSPWNGFGFHDISKGWFYWALAASFYLHLNYGLFRGKTRWRLFMRSILLRGVLYVAGGFFYNNINSTSPLQENSVPLNKIRLFGIFQRVGLANLITSSVEIIFMKSHIKRGPVFQDVRDTWPQWLAAISLVMTHTGITLWLPVPGCPTGYTGPGGLSDKSKRVFCTGGAAGYIDRLIFHHTQILPPLALEDSKPPIYNISQPFDPEGLLGTLTTSLLMSLAMQASRIFLYFQQPFGRIIRLFFWATGQLLLGGVLCSFQQEEGLIPPNRLLMSVPYVLLVSGTAYLTLLIFYLFINVWRLWSAKLFIYQGINMVVALVGCRLFNHTFPFHLKYLEKYNHLNVAHFLTALWNIVLWNVICYSLLKLRIVFPV